MMTFILIRGLGFRVQGFGITRTRIFGGPEEASELSPRLQCMLYEGVLLYKEPYNPKP